MKDLAKQVTETNPHSRSIHQSLSYFQTFGSPPNALSCPAFSMVRCSTITNHPIRFVNEAQLLTLTQDSLTRQFWKVELSPAGDAAVDRQCALSVSNRLVGMTAIHPAR